MRGVLKNGLLYILVGIAAVVAGQILLLRNQNLGPELALKKEANLIKKRIVSAVDRMGQYQPGIISGKTNVDFNSPAIMDLNQHGIDVFIFHGETPIFWTTQAFNMSPRFRNGVEIQKHASRYIMLWSVFKDTAEYIFTKEIIANPEFHFVSSITLQEEAHNKFGISINPLENSMPLEVEGLPLFYLVIEQFSPGVTYDLILVFGLILITLGIVLVFRKTPYWYLAYSLNMVVWVATEWAFYKNYTLWNLKTLPLFAPEVYASSWYFPNLGIMLVNMLIAFCTFTFLQVWFKRRPPMLDGFNRFLLRLLFTVILCVSAAFLLVEIGKLVRDSSIVFDFHEIHLISVYTAAGLVGLALGFGALFRMFTILDLLQAKKKSKIWFFLISLPALFITTFYIQSHYGKMYAFLLVFFLSIIWIYQLWFRNWRPWLYTLLCLFVPSIVVGLIFNRAVGQKEIELREILAAKLLLQSEREPTSLLQKTEIQLRGDKGIVDYYTCTDETKSDFDKRLRQLYFSEYAEDFEIIIYDYNAIGLGYREELPISYLDLHTLYTSNACKPVTTNFSLVNERKLKGSFLGRFPVLTDSNGRLLGVYFVLLKPRIGVAQGRLSDVFHKSPLEALFADNQYSYAFYSRNKLSRRYGQYYYPDTYTFDKHSSLSNVGGFSHFSYSDDLGNIIVISKPEKSWLQALTAFTILVLSCLVAAMLYLLVILLWQYFISIGKQSFSRLRLMQILKNQLPPGRGSDLFLSRKLQLYVILVVFATFIVVLFVTINYFKNSYSSRQKEFLWGKTNEIANSIGTQANLDALFNKYQTGLVYDLSNYYSTDINIYNARGKLIVSSNDRIYDQDLMGSLMNPLAFRDFTKLGISGFIKEEKVGDLKYISAYYTIFDNDLNVKGYLNLPYFTNRQDLYREISNYASTVINLFALVFALAALVAYVIAHRITEPLNLIRHQMALVKLGARNAPISWQHNDEIGLLIVEYNKMINALEESSNRLAESEREGAWREMAKQVAHEIKNPLTPMKLSLQHLQFAIQRKDDNIEDKIKKTSELLINQIDSLSRMAEEFSAFAKMPDTKKERTLLNKILEEAVNLFSKEENFSIEYNPLEKDVWVNIDQHQMGRVFANIIKNAVQSIPPNKQGLLRIHGALVQDKVSIFFEDNGKGIPAELRNKIFSPNFSTKNSGMGLGLAISRKIMEQFSGEIDFISRGDKGTTFFVTLPLADS